MINAFVFSLLRDHLPSTPFISSLIGEDQEEAQNLLPIHKLLHTLTLTLKYDILLVRSHVVLLSFFPRRKGKWIMTSTHEPGHPDKDTAILHTIDQVATRTGLTKRTLRYYEEVGLLPPTGRTEGNYRRYSETDVQRIERIKELRDLLGFSLADIRELLDAEDERGSIKEAYQHETDATAKIAQLERADVLIRQQLHLIEQKISGLEQMRTALLAKLKKYSSTINELKHKNK
jgi:DNA-binding transcriptional MerR regulator